MSRQANKSDSLHVVGISKHFIEKGGRHSSPPELKIQTGSPAAFMMLLPEEGHLLRIFIGETDKYEGRPLFEWIVRKAREQGLAGATVLRGLMGFGAHSRISTAKILRLSEGLPIVVEIIDTREKIEEFLPIIDKSISEGLATLEKVQIRFYRSGK